MNLKPLRVLDIDSRRQQFHAHQYPAVPKASGSTQSHDGAPLSPNGAPLSPCGEPLSPRGASLRPRRAPLSPCGAPLSITFNWPASQKCPAMRLNTCKGEIHVNIDKLRLESKGAVTAKRPTILLKT